MFQKQDNYGETQTYHMMTSVSLPVYDKKPRQVSYFLYTIHCHLHNHIIVCVYLSIKLILMYPQNITEKKQINEAIWITVTREVTNQAK